MKYYKFLKKDGIPIYGTGKWKLPNNNSPGEWMPKISKLVMCDSGYHVVDIDNIIWWAGPFLYEVEVKGEALKAPTKSCWQQARLLRQITEWNYKTIYQFVKECENRVREKYKKQVKKFQGFGDSLVLLEFFNNKPVHINEERAFIALKRFFFTIHTLSEGKELKWQRQRLIELLKLYEGDYTKTLRKYFQIK